MSLSTHTDQPTHSQATAITYRKVMTDGVDQSPTPKALFDLGWVFPNWNQLGSLSPTIRPFRLRVSLERTLPAGIFTRTVLLLLSATLLITNAFLATIAMRASGIWVKG